MTNNQLYTKIDEEMNEYSNISPKPEQKITLPQMHLRKLDEITKTLTITSEITDGIQEILFDTQREPKEVQSPNPSSLQLKKTQSNVHFFIHLEHAIGDLGRVADDLRRKVMKLDEQLS